MLADRTTWTPAGATRLARATGRAPAVGAPIAPWLQYAASAASITILGTALWKSGIDQANIFSTVPFILAVLFTALVWGRGPAVVASVAGAATFNYYYMGLPYRFEPPRPEEWLLFIAMLTIAVGLGTATDRVQRARRYADELAASEQFQKTLLNSISHDLRTPLTAIMGSLSTLLTEDMHLDTDARRELFAIAHEQTKVLNALVAQILEMTRLEAGAVKVQCEPGSLLALARLALAPMDEMVNRRCRVRVAPDVPMAPMDLVLLSHAVRNVIDNAARYSSPDTPIEVEASVGAGSVRLTIADRGIGIPAAELERVFEKFYQVPGTAEAGPAGGTGLGLAISKGIVEAHGGRIWAERRDGGGTVIRLTLPVS